MKWDEKKLKGLCKKEDISLENRANGESAWDYETGTDSVTCEWIGLLGVYFFRH